MTLLEIRQKMADRVSAHRVAVLSLMLTGLVSAVSATALNDSIAPIIIGVTLLFTPLLAVITAGIPLIITLAIIGFIMGILAMILNKMR